MSDDLAIILSVKYDEAPVNKLVTGLTAADKAYARLDKAFNAGKITIQQYGQGVAEIENKINRLTTAVNNGAKAAEESQKAHKKLATQIQQAGYQVGDFVVQVSNGTNPLVAFGQQGAQLAGFFGGPWGAAIGAGIAIVAALAIILEKSIPSLKSYEDALKDLKSSFTDVNATIDILQSDKLAEKFGNLSSIVKDLATSTLELDRALELKNLTLTLDKLTSKNIDPSMFQTIGAFLSLDTTGFQNLQQQTTQENYSKLGSKIPLQQFQTEKAGILSSAKSGDVEGTVKKLDELFKQMKGDQPFTDMNTDLQTMLSELSKVAIETAQVEAHYNGTAKAAKDLHDQDAKGAQYASDQLSFANQENAIQETILKYGKDSIEVDKVRGELASAKVEAILKEKFAQDGISKAEQNIIDQASAAAYIHETNAGLITRQAEEAQKLAQGLREAVTAMNALQSFSEGLDKQLGEAVARVNALKSGADATVAGKIAGLRFDYNQKVSEAISKGVDPSIVEAQFGKDRATIALLEGTLTQESGIKAAEAASKRGPSTDTIENKLKTLYTYLDKTKQVNKYITQEEDIAYKQRQSLLEVALKKGLITRQEYADLEKDLAVRHQQELSQINFAEQLKKQQEIFDTVKTSMEDAFMSMVDGTKSAKDAFKSMAAAIIKELYNVLVVQRMVGSFNQQTGVGSGLVGLLVKGIGGAFGGGSGYVKGMAGRADGGPISAGVPYMVGERGPEMIIPKSSGTVLTNGQTKAALGGSENYTVNNHISVVGSDSAMVRQEIAKMIPQISSATKAAMIDAKKRGGQMGAAFR